MTLTKIQHIPTQKKMVVIKRNKNNKKFHQLPLTKRATRQYGCKISSKQPQICLTEYLNKLLTESNSSMKKSSQKQLRDLKTENTQLTCQKCSTLPKATAQSALLLCCQQSKKTCEFSWETHQASSAFLQNKKEQGFRQTHTTGSLNSKPLKQGQTPWNLSLLTLSSRCLRTNPTRATPLFNRVKT